MSRILWNEEMVLLAVLMFFTSVLLIIQGFVLNKYLGYFSILFAIVGTLYAFGVLKKWGLHK